MDFLDIRKEILKSIETKIIHAVIRVDRSGVLAGVNVAIDSIESLELEYSFLFKDGDTVSDGEEICHLYGTPESIVKAEEVVMGRLAKTSGIATATRRAMDLSEGKCKIIAGAWKKMPNEIKKKIQQSVRIVGANTRLVEGDFIYLDKNYIRMLGGIENALKAVSHLHCKKVIQIKGEFSGVYSEVIEAIENGANVVMIDTGNIEDLVEGKKAIRDVDKENIIQVGFASEVKLNDIPNYTAIGIDFLCIGKEIIDAQLLDMKLDVVRD